MIKAIETEYRGYRFRSRGEAKWAVFMDTAGVQWDYEPEGFETSAGRYLPDFFLPTMNEWLEIKPVVHLVKQYDIHRAIAFGSEKNSIHFLVGKPWPTEYRFHDSSFNTQRMMWMTCPNCKQVVFAEIEKGGNHPGETHFWCPACELADPLSNGFGYCREGFDLESCKVRLAFMAARKARFEHGEKP